MLFIIMSLLTYIIFSQLLKCHRLFHIPFIWHSKGDRIIHLHIAFALVAGSISSFLIVKRSTLASTICIFHSLL